MTTGDLPPLREARGIDAFGAIFMSVFLTLSLGLAVWLLLSATRSTERGAADRMIDLGFTVAMSIVAWLLLRTLGVRR